MTPCGRPLTILSCQAQPIQRVSGVLTKQNRQEALSKAYFHAMLAKTGWGYSVPVPDYGVDFTIGRITKRNGRPFMSRFKLDVQLKSSVKATIEKDKISYALKVKAYEDLTATSDPTAIGPQTPRILVLVSMPEQESDWLEQDEERLMLRGCGYWLCLRDDPEITNSSTITVKIPRANLFTPESLQRIMDKITRGEGL